ncbi:hypothetical protein K1T71_002558 [Dendrolimus kikuchii]|uniref:Uncharacterized protein n=1 Tax=Dendrolimus kikuchii TaxID=765133 RepID=A0ACC1DDD4_9NEOP|nr:hypothetical protein K1T71_002558 [Dendrolimus kikuchii]
MFNWIFIFVLILFYGSLTPVPVLTLNSDTENITTCEEFERGARFNPYFVIDTLWKIFYSWANITEINPIAFSLPARKKLAEIKNVVDAVDPHLGVEWNKAALIMEPRIGVQVLLLSALTPGAFRALVKVEQRHKERPQPQPLLKFADLRIKIVGPYVGMMCCEDLSAYALARIDSLPNTELECESAAATIGYRGPNGRAILFHQKRALNNEF